MIKKIGLILIVVSVISTLFTFSVSAAISPEDGGVSYPKLDYSTLTNDCYNYVIENYPQFNALKDDFKYFYVTYNNYGDSTHYYNVTFCSNPMLISPGPKLNYIKLYSLNKVGGNISDSVSGKNFYNVSCKFSNSNILDIYHASSSKNQSLPFLTGDWFDNSVDSNYPTVIYASHDIRKGDTNDFFLVPSWTLAETVVIPLGALTRDFLRDFLAILKIGLIVLASLLAVSLISRFVRWGMSWIA